MSGDERRRLEAWTLLAAALVALVLGWTLPPMPLPWRFLILYAGAACSVTAFIRYPRRRGRHRA